MRYSILTIIAACLVWSACDDEIDLLNVQDDLTSLQEEMVLASAYNDSLASYINLTGISTDDRCQYFDDHFHLHDSLYNEHHKNYNSTYGWNHHNMGGGMHGQNHQNNSSGGMRNCQENDDFMDSLRHAHLVLHPDL